jgi:pyrroloquinoline-quinone synthase
MLKPDEFSKALYDALHSHLTLNHPLIPALMRPEPNWQLLRALTLQGYQLTKNFLTYVEHLFFYCPFPDHKKKLLVNLFEEETGKMSRTKNHVVLMQDFIRAIGVSDEERDAAVPYPETAELIDYRMERVKNRDLYHLGAAAVMIASEGQNLESKAGEARHNLLGKVYGLPQKSLLFFSVHQAEDVGHVREGVALVTELCTTEKMQQEALEAVHHTCKLFWGMYDGVAKRHM